MKERQSELGGKGGRAAWNLSLSLTQPVHAAGALAPRGLRVQCGRLTRWVSTRSHTRLPRCG